MPKGSRALVLVLLSLLVSSCSAPWRAPVETRSGVGYSAAGGRIEGPTYRVQPGDTLYGIAWRAGVDYQDLAAWNRIAPPYTIYVRQQLRVVPGALGATKQAPAKSARKTAAAKPPAKTGKTATASVPATRAANTAAPSSATKPRAVKDVPSGSLRWTWPAKGRVVQTFSPSDPARKGIKIRGNLGQGVVASEAGEVVYSGSGLVGYGQLIIIKHNKEFLSAYGHNAKRLVREGDRVARGKVIAEMGTSAGQPQLHFEIRRRGKPVNPLGLLPRR
jgi:lipoprotein NlpD